MILPYIGLAFFIWIKSIFIKNPNHLKTSSVLVLGIFTLVSTTVNFNPVVTGLPGGLELLLIVLAVYLVKLEKKFDFSLFLLLAASIIKIEMFWCLAALLAHYCYRDNKNNLQMFIVLVMFLGELIISATKTQTNILIIPLGLVMLVRNLKILKEKNWEDPSNFVMCTVFGIILFKYIESWDLGLTSLVSIIFILYILITSFVFKEFNSNSSLVFVIIYYLSNQNLVLLFLIPLIIFLQKTTKNSSTLPFEKYKDEINVITITLAFLATYQALSYFKLSVLEAILIVPLFGLSLKSYLYNKTLFNSVGLDKIVVLTSLVTTLGIMFI